MNMYVKGCEWSCICMLRVVDFDSASRIPRLEFRTVLTVCYFLFVILLFRYIYYWNLQFLCNYLSKLSPYLNLVYQTYNVIFYRSWSYCFHNDGVLFYHAWNKCLSTCSDSHSYILDYVYSINNRSHLVRTASFCNNLHQVWWTSKCL
jgi:hypothetical protein